MALDSTALRAKQAPLKQRYRDDPSTAVLTLHARGRLGADDITCKIETGKGQVEAGLHPATGGDDSAACSGDMLLEALVACAGVTVRSVATAMGVALRGGVVSAEGVLDFRGTLGVAKDAPVGFRELRLRFDLDTDAPADQLAKLIELSERYCVIYQTLRNPPPIAVSSSTRGQ